MKQLLLTLALFAFALTGAAQEKKKYAPYYYQRATLFEALPVSSDDIIFVGNSITDGAEWFELFDNPHVKNRGISGDICMGVYERLDAILKGAPSKIFLLIGINDVNRNTAPDTIVARIGMIVEKIKKDSPSTRLYLQSVLPVTDHYQLFGGHTKHWQEIPVINAGLQRLAEQEQVTYVDLFSHFVDKETGKMNPEYSNDGLHLLGKGYLKWVEIVKPYVEEK